MSREFRFTGSDFNFIRALVAERTGISLSDAKKDMVYSRLSRRLRKLGLDHFSEYCDLLKQDNEDELIQFINAITTNLTSFFREKHHFEYLKETVLPHLFSTKRDKRIRIWSAGCSTGEEPYSIAMVLCGFMDKHPGWDVKILATDLDTNVVATAGEGVYTKDRVNGIDERILKKYFYQSTSRENATVQAKPHLKQLITFKQLNLMHQWPMKGPFDIIFCRNVVIYFDKKTQRVLFDRYANILTEDGHLFIGHSETLFKVTNRFQLIKNTMYKKRQGQTSYASVSQL